MPRRSRVHLDGVPLHIVQRGHNREPCFFCEEDYSSYLCSGFDSSGPFADTLLGHKSKQRFYVLSTGRSALTPCQP